MTIKDAFQEVFVGYNYINSPVKDEFSKINKTLHKDSIQYNSIISSKLVEKAFSNEIKKKYYIQPKDIIIFIKKPFAVGTYNELEPEEIVIPNNFVILRGINPELDYRFVSNYLDQIGIEKYVKEHDKNGNLTLQDIEEIELPNINYEKQDSISALLSAINKRSSIYSDILYNDDKIIKYALHSVLGDEND